MTLQNAFSDLATEAKQDNIITAIGDIAPTDVSGLATSAKQLPDNHQVTVSNPVTGGATETTIALLERYPFLYATEYDVTYNYIMKYKGANWLIQRETIATGVRDYCQGATTISTTWTNRASQAYGLAV